MEYAGFWKRAAAWVIDIFVVVLPLGAIFFIFAMIYSGGDGPMEYIDNQLALMRWKTRFFRLGMLGCMLYWSLMESSSKQATLGKQLMGIRVVDMEGHRISFGRAAGRALVKGLISNIFAIGYLITLFTKNSQALHDLIPGCLVLKYSTSGSSDSTSLPTQEPFDIPSPSGPERDQPKDQPPSSPSHQLTSKTPLSHFVETWRSALKGKHKAAFVYSLIIIITFIVFFIIGLISASISVSKDYALYEQVPPGIGRVYFVAKNYPAKGIFWRFAGIFGNSKASFFMGKLYDSRIPQDGTEPLAVKWYTWSAWLGNPNAQLNLGIMYLNGGTVEQDEARALKWFRRAAMQSNEMGQYMLGLMYDEGRGTRKDYSEAAKWYRKAAFQGYSDAQLKLGYMFDEGQGVEKNDIRAAAFYQAASEQGNSQAQYNLGLMYEYGEGVSKNTAAAIAMYKKAADLGHSDAWQRLKDLDKNSDQ